MAWWIGPCRIPWLVHWARSKESFKKANPYLQYCWAQLLYAVLDYVCLPFLLIVLVTLWRLAQLRKLWKSVRVLHAHILGIYVPTLHQPSFL